MGRASHKPHPWKLKMFKKRKASVERFEDGHYDRIQRYLKFIKCEDQS